MHKVLLRHISHTLCLFTSFLEADALCNGVSQTWSFALTFAPLKMKETEDISERQGNKIRLRVVYLHTCSYEKLHYLNVSQPGSSMKRCATLLVLMRGEEKNKM